jgi:hypothetical protein
MDVLFRISLAILRTNEADLLKCTSMSGIYTALESIPTRMWDADKLLKVRNTPESYPGSTLNCVYTLYRLKPNFDLP